MSPRRVQRLSGKGQKLPENTVFVGKGTRWFGPYEPGRPYAIHTPDATGKATRVQTLMNLHADDALALYKIWVSNHHIADPTHFSPQEAREALVGKNLACYCPPDQACHADYLLEIANHP